LTGALTIPSSVTSIGSAAFSGCSGFTGALTIPSSVTSIGERTFYNCSGLTGALTIPSSVTSIESEAFYGCSGFTGALTIPSSVTSIGNFTFSGCSGLTGALTIPSSVTSIGNNVFNNCSGFTGALTIPSSVTSIGSYVFHNCSGLTGALTIPSSVTSIDSYAFKGCSGLTGALTIPSSVTSIGYGVFYNCSGLTGALTISNSVTSIGNEVFYGCSGLTSVTIPDLVTRIGDGAFNGCSGFTGALTIPSSVTSIGEWAFNGCSGLTSLTIPSSVTSIGSYAFNACSGLTSVTNLSLTPQIIYRNMFNVANIIDVFGGLTLSSIYLKVPANAVSAYRQRTVWKDFRIAPIYTLTLDAQGGTVSHTSQPVVQGDTVGALPTPARTGYAFGGWYTEQNGEGTQYTADTVYSGTTDLTLYAKWTAAYTLTLDAQGGTVSHTSHIVVQGDTVGALPTPTLNGYAFGGWYTGQNGEGTQYTASVVASGDLTLYAKWTAATYTLTFDAQGGTVSPNSKTATYDAVVDTLPTPTRSGYAFGGWYTEQNGEGTQYTADTVYRGTTDLTLYAKWTANGNGGGSTGVSEVLQANVSLYPNPFTSALHLTGAAGCTLTVVTSSGAIVHIQKLKSASEAIPLDRLPSGVYFLRLEKDGKTKTVKAVKE
jgi:uncharacterized repeat protein (TIGR02543 family)